MSLFTVGHRVKQTTTTTGTGTLSLDGSFNDFQTFVNGVGASANIIYTILDANGTAWEVAESVVTDATTDTLSRGTLIDSSTGSRISLSAGTHTVFISPASVGHQYIENRLRHGFFLATSDGTTTQSINTATFTKLTAPCNTESYDLESWYDHTTNYRYTPLRAGIYLIGGGTRLTSASGEFILSATKNGSDQHYLFRRRLPSATSNHVSGMTLIAMNGTTDYVELQAYHTTGSAVNTHQNAPLNYFSGFWIGPSS